MTEVIESVVAPVKDAHVPSVVTPTKGRGQAQLINDLGAVQQPEFVPAPYEQGFALGLHLVWGVFVDADDVAEVKLEDGTRVGG